jgi:asparagine synthase (glutamine-hydrolysing)
MSSQAGIFYFDQRPIADDVIDNLITALGVADIDAQGEHHSKGLFMAHAATWIDDAAAQERQPYALFSERRITFDGRLDNREDLLLRLRDPLRGQGTDCSLALAAYEEWGLDGLVHLLGDWSLALWEPATRSVVLASDHAGVRPLYYQVDRDRVVWSSYLKPLASFVGATDLDDQFVAGFLAGSGSPGRTPYPGILCVPPGKALRFAANAVEACTFWKIPVHNQIRYENEREYDEQLRALFRESIRARLRTSYPVCAELSGGLDSSSIVCMAHSLISKRQAEASRVLSVSLGPPGAPDEKFYTAVQRVCDLESRQLNTDDFPYLSADYLDEASPAPWGALQNQLALTAKQAGARVYLTGQGGDALMGNWIDDCEQLASHFRRGRFKSAFTEAIGWSKATRLPVPAVLWRGALASLPGAWPVQSRYRTTASPVIRERYGDSITPSFKSKTGLADPDWTWSRRWKEAPPDRRKHFKTVSKLLESGAFRPPERMQHLYYGHPYAHRPLVEFLLAIPADVLCKPGQPRSLMRRAFRELLPPEIVRRRSKGSYTGIFLESVRPAAQAMLTDSKLLVVEHGYVDPVDVRERLQRITQSLNCNEPQLRQIVLLEFWLRARSKRSVALPTESAEFIAAAS